MDSFEWLLVIILWVITHNSFSLQNTNQTQVLTPELNILVQIFTVCNLVLIPNSEDQTSQDADPGFSYPQRTVLPVWPYLKCLVSQDKFVSQKTPFLKKKGQDSLLVNVKCITVIPDMFYPKWKKSLCHRREKVISHNLSLKQEEITTITRRKNLWSNIVPALDINYISLEPSLLYKKNVLMLGDWRNKRR